MVLLLYAISSLLASCVVGHAFYQRQQFYPVLVYIMKSSLSIAVIHIQCLMTFVLLTMLLCRLFLGSLRATELDYVFSRICQALPQTTLVFAFFRDAVRMHTMTLFILLLFLQSFHLLVEKRVDIMSRFIVNNWLPHLRVVSLWALLFVIDCTVLAYAYDNIQRSGSSVHVIMGFECCFMLTIVLRAGIKHWFHIIEEHNGCEWQHKTIFLLSFDLFVDFIKLLLSIVFVYNMALRQTLPLFLLHSIFVTMRDFSAGLKNLIQSWRAIHIMNRMYPDASVEELRDFEICAICRDSMTVHAKKLPCGHIFHTICLNTWYRRQRTCPICRYQILATSVPMHTNPNQVAAHMPDTQSVANMAPAAVPLTFNWSQITPQMLYMLPVPYMTPTATTPDLSNFSTAQLSALEGEMLANMEERLNLLRHIEDMLNNVNIMMNTYQTAIARMEATAASERPEEQRD